MNTPVTREEYERLLQRVAALERRLRIVGTESSDLVAIAEREAFKAFAVTREHLHARRFKPTWPRFAVWTALLNNGMSTRKIAAAYGFSQRSVVTGMRSLQTMTLYVHQVTLINNFYAAVTKALEQIKTGDAPSIKAERWANLRSTMTVPTTDWDTCRADEPQP